MISISAKSSGFPTRKDLEDFAEQEIKSIIRQMYLTAVRFSPVYTGSFRYSWRVALNRPNTSITNGGSPGAPLAPPPFYWPKGFKLGDTIILSNSQPYAELIENGWSGQAPYGVIKIVEAQFNILL